MFLAGLGPRLRDRRVVDEVETKGLDAVRCQGDEGRKSLVVRSLFPLFSSKPDLILALLTVAEMIQF